MDEVLKNPPLPIPSLFVVNRQNQALRIINPETRESINLHKPLETPSTGRIGSLNSNISGEHSSCSGSVHQTAEQNSEPLSSKPSSSPRISNSSSPFSKASSSSSSPYSEPNSSSSPSLKSDSSSQPCLTVSSFRPQSSSAQGSTAIDSQLDVYARMFVPRALTIINTLDPIRFDEAPDVYSFNDIGYRQTVPALAYASGNRRVDENPDFLPLSVSPSESKHANGEIGAQQKVFEENAYWGHFEHLIRQEYSHHHDEHKRHALYDQRLQIHDQGHGNFFSFTFPGIREEAPFIRSGDIVELRELLDLPMMHRLEKLAGALRVVDNGGYEHPHMLGWTGLKYVARVAGTINATETVVLLAPRLSCCTSTFNIILPVPQKPYIDQIRAVAYLGTSLDLATPLPPDDISRGIYDERPWIQSMLFPIKNDGIQQKEPDSDSDTFHWSDQQLNPEQKKAVRAISENQYGPLPYLISGPPGTGKTKTLVETATQLIRTKKSSHILMCAPSDPACDILVERLSSQFLPAQLLRLQSPARTFAEVSPRVRDFCHMDTQQRFQVPDFRTLMTYQIVVTSCRDASLLVDAGLTNDDLAQIEVGVLQAIHPTKSTWALTQLHWDALLLDEAAQATEPEAAIPLSVVAVPIKIPLANRKMAPLVVMAGDEYQLGPRTYSHDPRLQQSLFARLFERPVYSNHRQARKKIASKRRQDVYPMRRPPFTNLVRNYRSHPSILAIPSYLFYSDTLLIDSGIQDELKSLPIWKGSKWPVLFVENRSNEDQDDDGGGWYNKVEAQKALEIAQQVLSTRRVEQEEICIMSPFAAQVRRLRVLFRESNLDRVNIGPCEAFQGLESRFVIVCTTRSKERFLERDIELCKGLIKQPNRFNVALTRARHGLVVIGNPELLGIDHNWRHFMDFCFRNELVESSVGGAQDTREMFVKNDEFAKKGYPRLEKLLLSRKLEQEMEPW